MEFGEEIEGYGQLLFTTSMLEIATFGLLKGVAFLESKHPALVVWLLFTTHDTFKRHDAHFNHMSIEHWMHEDTKSLLLPSHVQPSMIHLSDMTSQAYKHLLQLRKFRLSHCLKLLQIHS
jgi:hypothetical protein